MVNDFIFELGCEELPSSAVWPLANELKVNVLAALAKAQLQYGEVHSFATPRRLALMIEGLETHQPSQIITRRGPAAVAAFDKEGNPTPALVGFAKSCGVEVNQLTRVQTDKGEWMVYESNQEGKLTKELLPIVMKQAVAQLSISKPMRWGNGVDEFARPVHWVVMLYGNEVIEEPILGVMAGRASRGHRFHYPHELSIQSAQSYAAQLADAFVIADFAARKALIQEQIQHLAEAHQAHAIMPEALLDEVTSIVEWPNALIARFEKSFLDVPSEALIASMQSHQKCFALKDKLGALLPYFITVANIHSTNPQQVVLGNEKVMRARLSDAAFFFHQDKKQPLSHHIEATKQIVFQDKLGSVYQKTQRVQQLMDYLTPLLNLSLEQALRAAQLSKCDLLSGMVGEFPELQGLMGYYYALHDGEFADVAKALDEQYMPRFAADDLPDTLLGKALSLADRIDTLVGIFAIGQKPSGVKDPFKLRRHALAVVRILLSIATPISLNDLINTSLKTYGSLFASAPISLADLKPFILDRFNSYYQSHNIRMDVVQAVRARQDDWLYDADKRIHALNVFISSPTIASLSAACKRVNNLLSNAPFCAEQKTINETLFEEYAEHELYKQLMQQSDAVAQLLQHAQYSAILETLAALKEPVDTFFDQVMVMVDNEAIRMNRLQLLQRLQQLVQNVADISLLQ